MEGLYEVTNALSIFWVAAIFLLPGSPLRRDGRFCLIFARTAQQSVQMDCLASNHVRIVGLCIARTSLR